MTLAVASLATDPRTHRSAPHRYLDVHGAAVRVGKVVLIAHDSAGLDDLFISRVAQVHRHMLGLKVGVVHVESSLVEHVGERGLLLVHLGRRIGRSEKGMASCHQRDSDHGDEHGHPDDHEDEEPEVGGGGADALHGASITTGEAGEKA